MNLLYIFLILIGLVIITYILYTFFFKNLIFNKKYTHYNFNIENFENNLPDGFTQNVYSVKDLKEIDLQTFDNKSSSINFNDKQIDNLYNFIQLNQSNAKLQTINISKINDDLNKYKILFNNTSNKSLSLNHDNIDEIVIYSQYMDNDSNSWKIIVNKYNNFPNNNIIGHNIIIYSYLDLNKCLTLQEDGTFKLETFQNGNNKQLFTYNGSYLTCLDNESVLEINNQNTTISTNINIFYKNIIVKDKISQDLYRIFIDSDKKLYKQKISNYKVFSYSNYYNNSYLLEIYPDKIENLPEKSVISFKHIINNYLNKYNISHNAIIKKQNTYNYFLIETEIIDNNKEFKKICFHDCTDILSINNKDRVIDIYVRNINNKDIPVYILDENIINAIEYSTQEIIKYKNVISIELNKYMDLYNINKFLFNDNTLIIRKNGELYKKSIPNTEILNLFKLLYKENNDYMNLLFNYPVSELNNSIQNYIIIRNPLIVNKNNKDDTSNVKELNNASNISSIKISNLNPNEGSSDNIVNNNNVIDNIKILDDIDEKLPEILSAKYILYDMNYLGLNKNIEYSSNIPSSKYNYIIIKSDKGNIYYIGANSSGEYKRYKFYDSQQVQLAFYSKLLNKANILKKDEEYYILSENIIETISELGTPEFFSYKNILVTLWELNDNIHFDRRDKLMPTDKYADTYTKIIDIDKANKNYFMKILTYDMYQSLKLSNKDLEYRDKLANTNLTNNAFIQESSIGINREYYSIPEFLYDVMKVQQNDIITNKEKNKFYKVTLINDIKVQVIPVQKQTSFKMVANEGLFNMIKNNI